MEYRNVGRSGLKVSEIALGNWLTHGGYVAEESAGRCVNRAYELGINFFDTANAYMRGAAEEVLGKALRPYQRKHRMFLPPSCSGRWATVPTIEGFRASM